MKKTKSRLELATAVEQAHDAITKQDVHLSLASLADQAFAEAAATRENLPGLAAGLGWGQDPRTRLAILVGSVPPEKLARIVISDILESRPEVSAARAVIEPLREELAKAEAALAEYDAGLAKERRHLEERIAAATAQIEADPEVKALRERLAEING